MPSILDIFRRSPEESGEETAHHEVQPDTNDPFSKGSAPEAELAGACPDHPVTTGVAASAAPTVGGSEERCAPSEAAAGTPLIATESSAASSSGASSTGIDGADASSTVANAGDSGSQTSLSSLDQEFGAQEEHCQTVYEVNIKSIDGTVTKMDVPSNLRGLSLKRRILDRLRVPIERQRLIFRGRVVRDEDVLGHHITQSGQTIHLVQRPASSVILGNGSAQSSNSQGADGQPQDAPSQTSATDNLGNPPQLMTFPGQSELSQILGSMLSAVNRGGEGGPIVHTVPLVRGPAPPAPASTPTGAATPVVGPAVGAAQGADGTASSAAQGILNFFTQRGPGAPGSGAPAGAGDLQSWRRGWPSRECMMLSLLLGCLALVMPMLAWCIVQIEASFVVSSPPWHIWAFGFHLLGLLLGLPSLCLALRSPVRGFRALITPGGAVQGDQTPLTQILAAMAVQPLNSPQIVFQQGLNLGTANITATVQEEGFELPADFGASVGVGVNSTAPMMQPVTHADGTPEGLPWQELQGLSDHLDRLLHRPGRPGRLTAGGMPPLAFGDAPGAELQAFLASLHAATSQLGVGISDIQTTLATGTEPLPEQIRHLAMALASASQTFSSASRAVQGEFDGGGVSAAQSEQDPTPISTEVD